MRTSRGFTLIELLVTFGILAILVRLAVPSFTTMIRTNNMTGVVNGFIADMRYARSEAIRRGGKVVMCRSNLPETTQGCDGTNGATTGWATGWIIFHDLDGDGAQDAGETILRVQAPLSAVDSILDTATTPAYLFRYDATGLIASANTASLSFGGTSFSTSQQRVICVRISGIPRISGDGNANCN